MRYRAWFWLTAYLLSCSHNPLVSERSFAIGVDTSWYAADLYEQGAVVNGFIEDVLLRVVQKTGLALTRVSANWDGLIAGLDRKQYQAVLTVLPRRPMYEDKYDFSDDWLGLGLVLVVRKDSAVKTLSDLSHKTVGVLREDDMLWLQPYPSLKGYRYLSVAQALEGLVNQDVEGVLIDKLVASAYVNNLFYQTLEMTGDLVSHKGIRLMVPKGKHKAEMRQIERALREMQQAGELKELMKKWRLIA